MAVFPSRAMATAAPVGRSIPGARRLPARSGAPRAAAARTRDTLLATTKNVRNRGRSATRLAATADDIDPPPRDYTGELRLPTEPVVENVVVLPAMLFPQDEVLLPGSTQVLHLYEARFLALLDEVIEKSGGLFAHITFDTSDVDNGDGSSRVGLRLNPVASLVRVEEIVREDVGAKVVIVGESRVAMIDVVESEPYVRAKCVAIPTMGADGTLAYKPSDEETAEVEALTEFIATAVDDIVRLVDRLLTDATSETNADGDPGSTTTADSLWDLSNITSEIEWGHAEVGNLRRAMGWVEGPQIGLDDLWEKKGQEKNAPVQMDAANWLKPVSDEKLTHSELQRAERLSFACLQVAPTSSDSDLRKLASCRKVAFSTSYGLMVSISHLTHFTD